MLNPKRLLNILAIGVALVITFSLLGIQINDLGEELLNFNVKIILIILAHAMLIPPALDMIVKLFKRGS